MPDSNVRARSGILQPIWLSEIFLPKGTLLSLIFMRQPKPMHVSGRTPADQRLQKRIQ
jgi:hypothetical protein